MCVWSPGDRTPVYSPARHKPGSTPTPGGSRWDVMNCQMMLNREFPLNQARRVVKPVLSNIRMFKTGDSLTQVKCNAISTIQSFLPSDLYYFSHQCMVMMQLYTVTLINCLMFASNRLFYSKYLKSLFSFKQVPTLLYTFSIKNILMARLYLA